MKTILKYLVFVITIPLWLPGLILWGFLLWNSQGGNWWAFKLVFFLPKQSKTAELEKEVIELKRENSTLHNLMTTAERRGVEKAREESKNIQSDASADAEARGVVKGLRMAERIASHYRNPEVCIRSEADRLERELAAKEKP